MPTIRDTLIQFLQQIRSMSKTAPQPRGAEGSAPRLALSPGAEVLATVMGKLDNGMSLVRVSSQLFAMELPPRFQTGDSLRMTFLNQDARPTFVLANQTLSGTPLTMSSAGQLLRRLMREPVPDTVYSKSPLPKLERLLDAPPNDTTRLAGRLRQALGESGIFYESHLKEWAMGERPIAQLLREPQASLSRPETRTRIAEIPLPDRPVVGTMPAEPAVSGLPAENEAPDAVAASPREKQPPASPGREPAPSGARVHGGEIRPEERPESGKTLPRRESMASDTEGGADDTAIPTATDRRAESAAQESVRPGSDRVNRDGTPPPEKQPAESVAKEPGRPMSYREKHEEMPRIREEGGKTLREAASQQREVSVILPDELPRTSVSEHSAVSPSLREQGSLRQEPAEKPPATQGSLLSRGAEQQETPTDIAPKTPAAAEQRARLLKETYGRIDPALLKRDTQDVPAEMPRAETERNAGISRPDPAGMRAEANREAPQTSPAATPGLSPVEEREGKEAASVKTPLQGEIADARTLPLVRQQLNLLTSGMFLWQGEAWQGQPMEWEVRERDAQPEQGEEHGWQTTLRLELPNLGRVSGMINLAGKELRLTLEAGSADSASLLGRRTADLKDRLEAAGIDVKGVVVRHEELEGA